MNVTNRTPASSELLLGANVEALSTFTRDVAQTLTVSETWVMLVTIKADPVGLGDGVLAVALAGCVFDCCTAAAWDGISMGIGVGEGVCTGNWNVGGVYGSGRRSGRVENSVGICFPIVLLRFFNSSSSSTMPNGVAFIFAAAAAGLGSDLSDLLVVLGVARTVLMCGIRDTRRIVTSGIVISVVVTVIVVVAVVVIPVTVIPAVMGSDPVAVVVIIGPIVVLAPSIIIVVVILGAR